jgi:hypothetical protein
MRRLSHPAVLPLLCSFVEGPELWLVMPYMEARPRPRTGWPRADEPQLTFASAACPTPALLSACTCRPRAQRPA